MADFETATRSRMVDDAQLAALVGTRITWGDQPQGVAPPHVSLLVASDPRPGHLKGYQKGRWTRVQVDCRATDNPTAKAIALAVIAAFSAPGTFYGHKFGRVKAEGPRLLTESVNSTTIFRQSLDLIIWHQGD
jgi:hypothetical protein